MMIRSGEIERATSSAVSPSATGSTSKPLALRTSQNNFRLRSLSSTTIIFFVTARPILLCPQAYSSKEAPTIPERSETAPGSDALSAPTLALAALAWILEDTERADRYLELTGLGSDDLRAGLDDPAVLASALDFLANYEPDLIRAAEALAVTPEELIAARKELTG